MRENNLSVDEESVKNGEINGSGKNNNLHT